MRQQERLTPVRGPQSLHTLGRAQAQLRDRPSMPDRDRTLGDRPRGQRQRTSQRPGQLHVTASRRPRHPRRPRHKRRSRPRPIQTPHPGRVDDPGQCHQRRVQPGSLLSDLRQQRSGVDAGHRVTGQVSTQRGNRRTDRLDRTHDLIQAHPTDTHQARKPICGQQKPLVRKRWLPQLLASSGEGVPASSATRSPVSPRRRGRPPEQDHPGDERRPHQQTPR